MVPYGVLRHCLTEVLAYTISGAWGHLEHDEPMHPDPLSGPTVPADRRRSPRTAVTLPCTLARGRGGAIDGRTVDVGPGGMSVATSRPLSEDELLHFDLVLAGARHVDGNARVLRQERYGVYALRFEPPVEALRAVAAS